MKLLLRVNQQRQRRKSGLLRYRSVAARRGKSTAADEGGGGGADGSAASCCFGIQRGSLLMAASLAALVGVLLAFGVYFALNIKQHEVPYYDDIISDGRDSNATLGGGHRLIYRDVWGGVEPRATRRLYHPTPYVVLTHVGGLSKRCENTYACSTEMRNMQADHYIRFGSPDIGQNFMIGGDGNVYVGRGWDVSNFHVNSNVVVIFSGDYSKVHASPKQLDAMQRLLDLGVSMGKLSDDYKVIGHNQSTFTLSPGPNLYSEMIKWPHWYNCSYQMEVTCGAEINWPPKWGTAY